MACGKMYLVKELIVLNNYFYPAVFSKEGKFYNVKFVDFDNVFTFGCGFEDAYFMAQDALKCVLSDFEVYPAPTNDFKNIQLGKDECIILVS